MRNIFFKKLFVSALRKGGAEMGLKLELMMELKERILRKSKSGGVKK